MGKQKESKGKEQTSGKAKKLNAYMNESIIVLRILTAPSAEECQAPKKAEPQSDRAPARHKKNVLKCLCANWAWRNCPAELNEMKESEQKSKRANTETSK